MIQPAVLSAIPANRQFRGRGFLARILYAYPMSKVGHRLIASASPDPTTVAGYEAAMRGLATGMGGWVGDPAVLTLTPTAHKAMLAIEEAVEHLHTKTQVKAIVFDVDRPRVSYIRPNERNQMSSTNVTVTRDEEGKVHAHWVGSVSFDPTVYGDPDSFQSLIVECVEHFKRDLLAEINADFQGVHGQSPG